MSRRNNNFKPWNSRLSAGGANRTNIRGQTRRQYEPGDEFAHHQLSNPDVMPRYSSFRPLNSHFTMAPRRRSPEQFSHWDPPPSLPVQRPPRRDDYRYVAPQERERSPEFLLDSKGRPIPKKGMFLNAKHSEVVPPNIDEEQIRRTEEMIRRIAGPSRQTDYDYQNNYGSNELRDKIRQVVYDMGVPDEYRARAPSPLERYESTAPRRRSMDPYVQNGRRQSYRRDVIEEDEEEDNSVFETQPTKKRRKIPTEEREESRPGTSTSVRVHSRSQRKRSIEEQKEKRRKRTEEESSDEECSLQKSLNSSGRSLASKTKEDRPNTSRGSRNSSIVLPPSPQYSKDPDEDDNWRNSLQYMSKSEGAGAALFSRIGSAIPSLPLKDNTRDNYSKVATMFLNKSIKEMNQTKENGKRKETLQAQIMNMSTIWPRMEGSPEVLKTPRPTLINEVSKIQHPHNMTHAIEMDESLFRNSKFFEEVAGKTKERARMAPPAFQSSPKSNDVFRSDEGFTMPSSIRKTQSFIQNMNRLNDDEEEEEPPSRHETMDDYIARGASQLTFSKSPDVFPSSSKASHSQHNLSANTSRRSNVIEHTPRQNSSYREKTRDDPAIAEKTSLHLNSCFQISAVRKKSSQKNAMLDFDEETQKMFEDAFGHEERNEEGPEQNKEKFSFRL